MRQLPACALAVAVALVVVQAGTRQASAQDPRCQTVYKAETRQIHTDHTREAQACRGDSQCIAAANKKKGEASKKAGEKLHECNRVVLKPRTGAELDPKNQWSDGGTNEAIFTDLEGRRWSFAAQVVQRPYTFVLQRGAPPVVNKLGDLREAYGSYREIRGQAPDKTLRGRLLP